MAIPTICGPKLSAVCAVISLWGVVMLFLLGIFFFFNSPALVEDLPIDEHDWEERNFDYIYIKELYFQNAINCWVAAALYGGTFIFSVIMFKLNQRNSYNVQA